MVIKVLLCKYDHHVYFSNRNLRYIDINWSKVTEVVKAEKEKININLKIGIGIDLVFFTVKRFYCKGYN